MQALPVGTRDPATHLRSRLRNRMTRKVTAILNGKQETRLLFTEINRSSTGVVMMVGV